MLCVPTLVLLEPVRSAEPPNKSGTAGSSASIAFCEATRVASFCGVFRLSLYVCIAAETALSTSPLIAASKASLFACAPSRASHAARSDAPLPPAVRQASRISAGISNGADVQPIDCLVSAFSSAPSGAPCALAVPARFGEPLPISVLQRINVGLLRVVLALLMAAETASISWPSQASTSQP